MIFVDSSVWIDFYNGIDRTSVRRLEQAITEGHVIVGDLLIAEVLQGFRHERSIAVVEGELMGFDVIAVSDPEIAIKAASNHRALRLAGVTVRKTIDTLIATRCIIEGWPLLYDDGDFDPFVEHLGLQSALA